MLTALSFGIFNKDPRVAPFTDVTSISEINYDGLVLSIFFQSFIIFYFQAKPTENGELCKLPYKINPYTWDMYFCNKGFCPTATSSNSKCASGQFAHVRLFDTDVYSVSLEVGTDGINEQCIIYYYYYIPKRIDIQMSIKLRKVEVDSTTEIIDHVTNSSFNGWTQQKINFQARKSGYMARISS
ncbi:unnamed protein product [Rotaria magnacalcarata]|uniref:Uncharacterized protein n=1 Tax=Rotaria magnacalcarata TaxID=392030 RepID=A0A816V3M0_9BILA|nr:unnamed protein product [Rotaria magnacalcarata]CAF2242027.1 unnamed protein product [Rotaria magnacalcarata]